MLVATSKASGRIHKRVACEHCGARYLYELSRTRRAVSFVPLLMVTALIACTPLLLFAVTPCFFIPLAGGGFFFFIRFRPAGLGILSGFGNAAKGAEGGGHEESAVSANKKLRAALLKGAELVPCPDCGWYQRHMNAEYRSRQLAWVPWVGVGLVAVTSLVAAWITTHGHNHDFGDLVSIGPANKFQTWLLAIGIGLICVLASLGVRWLLSLFYKLNQGFPDKRETFPDSPAAIHESDHLAPVAAATARLTPPRAPTMRVQSRQIPRPMLPPPPE